MYKKGQVIFHEGNRPHGVFCINEGKVKITRMGSDGKEQIVRLAKHGDVLGYRALIEGSKYSASAVALDDSKICFLSSDDFNHLVDNNMKVANDLLRLVAKALGEAEQKMTQLALKPVRERLAEALLLLQKTYGQVGVSPFSIAISREDLAAIVGTAKETVIRTLSEFKDDNIITAQGSTITIVDHSKLVKITQLYD